MNIYDVAKRSGVSRSTVSRVLSGGSLVKEETRRKVMEAIEELGYTPNTSAQKLAGGKNHVIGIINGMPISDPFYAYMDDLLAEEGLKRGYNSLYAVVSKGAQDLSREISMLYGKVDCFIITGSTHSMRSTIHKDVERLIQLGMPVAMFKTDLEMNGAITVDIDNVDGGNKAAGFLVEKGYRRIGYMSGDNDHNFIEGQQRKKGFTAAMEQGGLTIEAEFNAGRDFLRAYQLADDIIQSGIEALFCETDLMAYGVIQAFNEKGIAIPGRIAVMGFDNIRFSNYQTQIQLSTVSQPMEEMASMMVNALVDRIEDSAEYPVSRKFVPKIVERSTT